MKSKNLVNYTLLEWSEQQQTFHINDVVKGTVVHAPETNGFSTVYMCNTFDEAYLIAEYIRIYIKKETATKDGIRLTTAQVKRHIKAVIKLINSYNKLLYNSSRWN